MGAWASQKFLCQAIPALTVLETRSLEFEQRTLDRILWGILTPGQILEFSRCLDEFGESSPVLLPPGC